MTGRWGGGERYGGYAHPPQSTRRGWGTRSYFLMTRSAGFGHGAVCIGEVGFGFARAGYILSTGLFED